MIEQQHLVHQRLWIIVAELLQLLIQRSQVALSDCASRTIRRLSLAECFIVQLCAIGYGNDGKRFAIQVERRQREMRRRGRMWY